MSLVAYEASSDEESDCEDNGGSKAIIVENVPTARDPKDQQSDNVEPSNGHISDDEEFIPYQDEKEIHFINNLSKLLPKPKKESYITDILENFSKPTFAALPTPKSIDAQVDIEEEDDEFLHKKPSKEIIENSIQSFESNKKTVKITIPALKNFKDVEKELAEKARNRNIICHSKSVSSSGLLSMLPKAKSEQCFAKDSSTLNTINKTNDIKSDKPATPFVPDSVKHRRPATNTEDVERFKPSKKTLKNQINKASAPGIKADTDDSDDDNAGNGDFFSFNTDQNLPEVSVAEINSLVAKKAAKMIEASSNYLKTGEEHTNLNGGVMQICEQELESSRKRNHQDQPLNSEALQALVGGSTKRRRQQSNIQVIDLNSSQVMPKKDEWMRTALASSTTYQPTGVLVDEEPASGTRRKHQITYLAHKAKANEAELQAMWSANRQNRRATQSKYGF